MIDILFIWCAHTCFHSLIYEMVGALFVLIQHDFYSILNFTVKIIVPGSLATILILLFISYSTMCIAE